MTSPETFDWQQTSQQAATGAAQVHGYWRSLQELAQLEQAASPAVPPVYQELGLMGDATSRRRFLQLLGGSLALAGLGGCRQPEEKILPYVEMPEHMAAGKPLYFATAMPLHGYGLGVVAESHAGRPTKLEGNHLHSASGGASNSFAQASVLTLYDPDRAQIITEQGVIASRQRFAEYLRTQLKQLGAAGRGLHLLTGTITSPTLLRQIRELQSAWPEVQWHAYEPNVPDTLNAGSELAFGEQVEAIYHFERADVVFSLGSDFLNSQQYPPAYAGAFMRRRRVTTTSGAKPAMNRLYAIESTPSLTGSKADHRWSASPSELIQVARALAQRFEIDLGGRDASLPPSIPSAWIDTLAEDLRRYRRESEPGHGLVIAGRAQPAEVHALAHAINQRLAAVGTDRAVHYIEPIPPQASSQVESLLELTEAMQAGEVKLLVIVGTNPVFNAPADFNFAAALKRVPHAVHLSMYHDETSAHCRWHLPGLHYLEAWSDVRSYNGQTSIVQPLIAPLYGGISEHELLDMLNAQESSTASPYEMVRQTWSNHFRDFPEQSWDMALKTGVIEGTAAPSVEVTVSEERLASLTVTMSSTSGTIEIVFQPDPTIDDGTYANNAWLQELPKPFTKLTWDNAALISSALAQQLELSNGDMVRIRHQDRSIEIAAWIMPGQAANVVTLHYGYGRTRAGNVGNATGFNVFPLRSSEGMWSIAEAMIVKTGKRYELAATQTHYAMEGRHPVEHGTLAQWNEDRDHPPFMHHSHTPVGLSLYDEDTWKYEGYKWGMAVDLTSCTGCNACVVACQAENNIPVVGKSQIAMGREMHWMRIDSYYHGAVDQPEIFHQPVMCMHCENAPCEVVCPVAATSHSAEGLNEMTYNRCVGTRYCANNCPYKVRRFNFLQYTDETTPVLKLLRNPEVTARSAGVMEKCTYCVQRINHARIDAQTHNRAIPANEPKTACQSACPTEAISFGDLNNPQAHVNQRKASPLDYLLLADQGTRPRTSYQAQLNNPNPNIKIH